MSAICARFWLSAAFGILLGLSVAGFGISLYNRWAAVRAAGLIVNVELDTSLAIQNISRIEQSIIALNVSVSALNLTEIAYIMETVRNVTRDLYGPFVNLSEHAIFSFNGNTTRPVDNNVDLEGRFGVIVSGWNVNGSIMETAYNDLETEVSVAQQLIQVQLTNELIMLETNALRSVNGVVFPSSDGLNRINFTGTCNMSVVTTGQTISFQTCAPTPNAYNCSVQLEQIQAELAGINQTLTNVYTNYTSLVTQFNNTQLNIANLSALVSLKLNTPAATIYGPNVTWTSGTNIAITTNATGIYVNRTGGIDRLTNSFNQSTTSRHLVFQSGSSNVQVTTNNVNTVTVATASASDNSCVQYPNPSYIGINVFSSLFTNGFYTNVWYPAIIQGGVGLCYGCGPSIFCSYWNTDNCPGFAANFDPPDCVNYQGWIQEPTAFPNTTDMYVKMRVPTVGKVWVAQIKVLAALTANTDLNNVNALTFGLVDPTGAVSASTCNGNLIATAGSTVNLLPTTNSLVQRGYYYYGEITFSTEDPDFAPGSVFYLCMYFSGPGPNLPGTNAMIVVPSLLRLS